jgi:hypothetical protein
MLVRTLCPANIVQLVQGDVGPTLDGGVAEAGIILDLRRTPAENRFRSPTHYVASMS